ncbi:uncharacterized protein LOC128679855 [Plodia interpunctella]|uniref:uncharacterized protein LOC128679855 n=1 Tax=Plodia interpunctella TaxID=58824 RepID=UPI0023675DCA|nr:uncharacterized protein LOC128679855 [Plodia interpunctella]
MSRLCVCFLYIFAASVVQTGRGHGFYYTKHVSIFRRQSEEECRVCFGHDCVPLTEIKCQYYMATSELQNEPDDEEVTPNNELQVKLDTVLYDYIDSHQDYDNVACISMLSTYTDCHKDNICTGCTTCTCDEGRWVCAVEECHAERLDFNRQLSVALASLKSLVAETGSENQDRKKRSTNKTKGNEFESKITFEELSLWMNDTKMRLEEKVNYIAQTTEQHVKATTNNSEDLGFEEVLSNIALDNNKIRRKKPKLEPVDGDYVRFVEIVTGHNATDVHTNRYADKVEIEDTRFNDDNSFKVDLLENLKARLEKQFKIGNNTVPGIDKEKEHNFEINNYLDDVNSLGIVKRDVSKTKDANILPDEEKASNNNDTMNDFKNNVLYPLISIISDKENELNQLFAIKNSLIALIEGMDSNFTLDMAKINSTSRNKTLFSIYKLEIVPETALSEERLETRRVGGKFKGILMGKDGKGIHILDMYLQKLRHDVFEIIRDLRGIKQSVRSKKLPRDLTLLLRGLNHYVRSQGLSYMKNYQHLNKLRRFLPYDNKAKRMALELLELCDKEIGAQGSINQISDTTKGILQRIVKQNQIDDFVDFGVKISSPEDTLSKDLKTVGSKWPDISEKFLNISPSDKLYNLKLLHLMLTVDIDKMTNAMKLLNFAQNRRVNLDTTLSDEVMTKVQNDIADLNDKIQKYVIKDSERSDSIKQSFDSMESTKSRSFLKQIKSLFKTSRNDIRTMLNKKVSKSDIVKELAKNKLGELAKKKMAQYENTLKKWQSKLRVKTKRSVYDFIQVKGQMKNILPSYLRGKVTPAISKSMKERQSRRYIMYENNTKDVKGHKVQHNNKTTVKHKVTTPKTKVGQDTGKSLRKSKGNNTKTTTPRAKIGNKTRKITKTTVQIKTTTSKAKIGKIK